MSSKKAIIIAGPTASGKSTLALELALKLNTEIINADSRQCYVELGVAVAKPSSAQLRQVPHHFVNSHSFTQHVSAHDFALYCEEKVKQILHLKDTVIISGGTGLYLQAWLEGLSPIPSISDAIRQQVNKEYEDQGLQHIRTELAARQDPYLKSADTQNVARMKRAYEIQLQTGKSILDFREAPPKPNRDYEILSYALSPIKSKLDQQIKNRTHHMMQEGVVSEAMTLYPYRNHKNLKTVGYTEVYEGLENKWPEDKIEEQIYIHTRRYAKRQMTWYRNQGSYKAIEPEGAYDEILLSVLQ